MSGPATRRTGAMPAAWPRVPRWPSASMRSEPISPRSPPIGPGVIHALMSVGQACRALETPEGLKEARFTYLEAARLQQQIVDDMARDRDLMKREMALQARPAPARTEAAEPAAAMPQAGRNALDLHDLADEAG